MLYEHDILYAKKGDFTIDGKERFEIGGKNKSFKQVKDMPNSFVVADYIEDRRWSKNSSLVVWVCLLKAYNLGMLNIKAGDIF